MNEFFDWSKTWMLRFDPGKCKVGSNLLPIREKETEKDPPDYNMNKYERVTLSWRKLFWKTFDKSLSFANYIQNQVNKANQIAGLTHRSFTHIDNRTFTMLFKALVRPNLEYANSV